MLQRTLPQPFRAQVLTETGLPEYRADDDPRQVPASLRTARWRFMCDAVDAWPDLTADARCRLVLLLHALGFYGLVLTLVGERSGSPVDDPDDEELAYWAASARYVLGLPSRVNDYEGADLSGFERIAAARTDTPLAFNAALKILTHQARVGAPIDDLVAWADRSARLLEIVGPKADDFTQSLLTSRFHRAIAFLPMRRNDRHEVVRLMDLAERHGRAMTPIGPAQELVYLENLHPVMESRAKEALWLGDLDVALARTLAVVDLDPCDSRAWLEVGQVRLRRHELALAAEAYATAATLGAPSTAIARYMAGLCFRDLGQPLLAAFFFEAALAVDPRATSPHDGIQALPDLPVLAALKEWSLDSFSL